MRIKSVSNPKTIKIDNPTWVKLKKIQLEEERTTLDDTIWMLISRWEKQNHDL